MTISYNAFQDEVLQYQGSLAKVSLEIADVPLRICTGSEGITIDSDNYTPRAMKFDGISLTHPTSLKPVFELDNADKAITLLNFSTKFSGKEITIYFHIQRSNGAWIQIWEYNFKVGKCNWEDTRFRMPLAISGGFNKKKILKVPTKGRCIWVLGDGACKHTPSGSEICSGTLAECASYSQTANRVAFDMALEDGATIEIGEKTVTIPRKIGWWHGETPVLTDVYEVL